MLLQMLLEYQLAGRVQRAVEIDALLFAASDKIGIERPFVGDALLRDAPADAAVRDQLARIRHQSDLALGRVEAVIEEVAYPGAAAQLAVVRKTRSDLAVWRAQVDETLSHAKNQRDPNIFAFYIATLNAVFETTSTALDIGDLAASQHDGTSVELMSLASRAWEVRAAMGIRTVPLMAAIDGGVPLDSGQLRDQARFDGVLSANWAPIGALGRRLLPVPGLGATIVQGHRAFDEYDRLCHAVIAADASGTPYPIDALGLGEAAVRTARVLLKIRDEALNAALARVEESRQAALINVAVAAIVLALTVIAVVGVLIVLQRRIVSPVLALTEVIGRISRLEFNVTIPARQRKDEIGRMALALDALRRDAMVAEVNKAQIVHMARHDALTGLANRLTLQERLEQAVATAGRGQAAALLCLDLDRFKSVNDTFGHPTGDLLLQGVAERLLNCVREVDTVSRLGGDEFVVLLAGLERPEQAAVMARRIGSALAKPFDLDGQSVTVGSSIGIAFTPQDATSGIALLKRADIALYRAKQEEKGGWRFFQKEMGDVLQERMALERDLRDALSQDALEVVYQPQFRLSDDRLCGFEALLRWHHPQLGLIKPAAFIPIAEETGLILPISDWVLRQACAEAMHWPEEIRLALNVSGVQFKRLGLVQSIWQALQDSDLPASRLELEITETTLLNNSSLNLATLHELHGLGIQIAMDDFGTGYSSLSYLRSFPFDKIKIDQSFIRDLCSHADSQAIVRAVVALGNSLCMTTTAEGVETQEQLTLLRLEGCDDAQGYLLGRPLPAAAARLLAIGTVAATAAA